LRPSLADLRVRSAAANPVHLLRRVDQEEEQSERSRHRTGLGRGQRRNSRQELLQRGSPGLAPASIAARGAQAFDCQKDFAPLQALDHAPERSRQVANVVV
jgi:hypothetical protein